MTNMASHGVPEWELRHRLARSLEWGGISVSGMADYLGRSRNTIGNYLAGRTPPDTPVLKLWALRTGVPYEWLLTGRIPPNDPDGGPNSGPGKGMPWYLGSALVRRAA